ncbi:MAG: 4-alpha-glucanotransferase [Bradyrhizobiaceae bacterium]|nr:4-alpha-glucanotransferase [Hyphomicrobiales bacterium]MBV9426895.1 4-alpha-glucanotransferase [Bradyrhizobiaceae bacterium]
MSDAAVRDLARAAGIAVEWEDYAGEPRRVSVAVLRRILAALGLPCDSADDLRHSREAARATTGRSASPMITASVGEPIAFADAGALRAPARLTYEDGGTADVRPQQSCGGQWLLPPIATPGYHRLDFGERSVNLAVAPAQCVTVNALARGERVWGLAAQLYGLRRVGDGGIGDTGALTALAKAAARHGADAIAISPAHAGFTADPGRYRPYSPSSRLFLNPLHADPRLPFGDAAVENAIDTLGLAAEFARLEAAPLIDWPAAGRAKLKLLRRLFDEFADASDGAGGLAPDFAAFRAAGGELLQLHARFEALHADRLAADPQAWSWRDWPAPLRDPTSAAVEKFAARHPREILFHYFLQWLAERSFAAAQKSAVDAGMRIGLIGDLAVGMESSGSHAWSRQADILVGIEVGAPPDLFNARGQNWGLTAFSPRALVAGGFAPFIATLRAGMRNAGGLRIDHAMSLTRLWLIPEGARPDEGAYLAYPLDDLLRLAALESWRHRAIVIGEDLGTVPAGFRERLAQAGIDGMRVLWFEQKDGRFLAPKRWDRTAVAMPTTHDLPTVAGWWRGADIGTRAALGLLGEPPERVRRARGKERTALWRAFRTAGVASGRQPAPRTPERAIDAALSFVAATPAPLAIVPLEDALGVADQPNVPGTIDEHPNWRRRAPAAADVMLEAPEVAARLGIVDRQRQS